MGAECRGIHKAARRSGCSLTLRVEERDRQCRGIHVQVFFQLGDSPLRPSALKNRIVGTLSVEEQDRRQTQHLQVFQQRDVLRAVLRHINL